MTAIPDLFKQQIRSLLPDEADLLFDALGTEPSVSVRTNRRKAPTEPATDPVPWCAEGRYLDKRPQFTFDPFLHGGRYYVQDASSMFLSHVLRQLAGTEPLVYLDLCAAPGGKTTTAIDALPDGSLVVANEIDQRRAQVLRENVVKWGYPHCIVTNSDAHHLGALRSTFDIIAADMPCSGEGMFRKDDEAVAQWSPSLVAQCASLQKEIADAIWPALKDGGLFIYSTCTFNRSEDEDVLDYLINELGAEPVDVSVDDAWRIHRGVDTEYPCFRFMPHQTRGEGLFMAVVRKVGEDVVRKPSKVKKDKEKKAKVPAVDCLSWLDRPDDYVTMADGDAVCAVARKYAPLAEQVRRTAKTLLTGIPLAVAKGRDMVPLHPLSQSIALSGKAFPTAELDYPTAIAYLRGETITLPEGIGKGFAIVAYRGANLGFVKNLGNRANNLYPKEWRIRSGFVPTDSPEVL